MDARLGREVDSIDPSTPFRHSSSHTHHTWARTYHSRPSLYIQPQSLAEVQKVVNLARRCRRRIVVVGSGHSPSDLTCTSSWLVNLDGLGKVLNIDEKRKVITVEGGIRMHDLNLAANDYGLTMPNLGSIDIQSIAGALATGTHGSSLYHGSLYESVISLRICLADGTLVRCSKDENPELFRAALVSLGALGIIVEVEFQLVPATNIEWIQTLKPISHILSTWNSTLWTSAEFTRVWWLPYTKRAIVWRADKTEKPAKAPESNWYGGQVGYHTYHFLLWLSNYIPPILPAIEWFVFGMQYGFSLDSHISGCGEQRTELLMNCLYSQFVNEWAIPLEKGPEAITRLSAWINGDEMTAKIPVSPNGIWVHAPIEVRVSDNSKPSIARALLDQSSSKGPTLYLNATLYRPYGNNPPCTDRYYEAFEYLMKELGGRPHWAKNFSRDVQAVDMEQMYGDDLQEWRKVRKEVDPEGLFVGAWHRRNTLGGLNNEYMICEEVEDEEKRVERKKNGNIWFGKQVFSSLEDENHNPSSSTSSTSTKKPTILSDNPKDPSTKATINPTSQTSKAITTNSDQSSSSSISNSSSQESFDLLSRSEAERSFIFDEHVQGVLSRNRQEGEKEGEGNIRPPFEKM